MKLDVMIDGQFLVRGEVRGGISTMYKCLLPEVARLDAGLGVGIVVQKEIKVQETEALEPFMRRIPNISNNWRPWRFWQRARRPTEQFLLTVGISMMAPKVFHPIHYETNPIRRPSFCFVYDMNCEKCPDLFIDYDLQEAVSKKHAAIAKAEKIICISENTKKDVMDIVKPPEEKCIVAKLGPSIAIYNTTDRDCSYNPFFLYVGTFKQPYKNFSFMLKCLSSKQLQFCSSIPILVVCPTNPTVQQISEWSQYEAHKRLTFKVNCSDQELSLLYQQCSALIYPSLYEGFGLPVLDALNHGAPVACSSAASLPEVGGGFVSYFDPRSEGSFCPALEKALTEGRNESLVKKRQVWAKQFSWTEAAQAFVKISRELC